MANTASFGLGSFSGSALGSSNKNSVSPIIKPKKNNNVNGTINPPPSLSGHAGATIPNVPPSLSGRAGAALGQEPTPSLSGKSGADIALAPPPRALENLGAESNKRAEDYYNSLSSNNNSNRSYTNTTPQTNNYNPPIDYSNKNIDQTSNTSQPEEAYPEGFNFESLFSAPAATTPSPTQPTALSSGGSPYASQISSIKERVKKAKDEFDLYGNPTDEEKDLQAKIDALSGQIRKINSSSVADDASYQAGINEIEKQPIAMRFIQGQQSGLTRQAELKKAALNAQAQALAAEAEPLTTKLARLQSQRQLQQEAKKAQISSIESEYQDLLNEQKSNAPQRIEVGGNLIEYDPVSGQYRTVFSPQQNESYKPVEVGSGGTLVDPRTGKVIYSSPGSTTGKVTDDIAEFNLARDQGFKGSFVDFKKELANLKEGGSQASNLPNAYKEYQLSQQDPGFASYLNQSKATPVPAAVKSDLIDMGTLNKMANEIKSIGEQSGWKGVGGFGVGTASQFLSQNLGIGSKESQNLRNFIGNLNGTIAKLRGGTSFTDSEKRLLETYTPTINDSPNIIKSKIDSLQKFLNFKTQSINEIYNSNYSQNIQISPTDKQKLVDAGYTEKQIQDYIQQKRGFNQPLSMGVNGSIKPVVEQKYPTGYKGGQCGDFAHKLVQFPSVGDGKLQKFSSVDKFGIQANQWRQNPKVGDVIITSENPTYGHVAVVNAVLPNGSIRLSESNFKGKETVSHDRVVSINSPKIYGAIRGQLKV